jgi:hypothetical protein
VKIPPRFKLYDDEKGALADVRVIWRKDREVGIAFELEHAHEKPVTRARLNALGGQYYALGRDHR